MFLAMRLIFVAWMITTLGACAPYAHVLLLPQASYPKSSVVVQTSTEARVLDQAYQRLSKLQGVSLQQTTSNAAEVAQKYAVLFDAMPATPIKYVLYFKPGGAELMRASEAMIPLIVQESHQRKGADLVVTGHTDSMGALLANDGLSLKRAQAVAQRLVNSGVPSLRIETVGRGKRELLVKTADNVDEPLNRRVEVVVR